MECGRQSIKQSKQDILNILKEFSLENSDKENEWNFEFPFVDIYLGDNYIYITPKTNSYNEIQISYESLCSVHVGFKEINFFTYFGKIVIYQD